MEAVIGFIVSNREIIEVVIAIIFAISSSARGAISATSELMQKGSVSEGEALQKASDLMGKWLPYVPDFMRKAIIQWFFNAMKTKVK